MIKLSNQNGQGLVEYALMTVLAISITVMAVRPLTNGIAGVFTIASTSVNKGAGTSGASGTPQTKPKADPQPAPKTTPPTKRDDDKGSQTKPKAAPKPVGKSTPPTK